MVSGSSASRNRAGRSHFAHRLHTNRDFSVRGDPNDLAARPVRANRWMGKLATGLVCRIPTTVPLRRRYHRWSRIRKATYCAV